VVFVLYNSKLKSWCW